MTELAISLYTDLIETCLPIAVFFGLCNLLVATFLRAALGGKLWFGKD